MGGRVIAKGCQICSILENGECRLGGRIRKGVGPESLGACSLRPNREPASTDFTGLGKEQLEAA